MRASTYAKIVGTLLLLAGVAAAIANETAIACVLFCGWACNALLDVFLGGK